MGNLNAEQIIKDLECCRFGKDEAKCKECNWHPWIKPRCRQLLASNALSLIKELTIELEAMRGAANSYKMHNKELTEENERLRTAIPLWAKQCVELEERCMQLRADTVRRMQERMMAEKFHHKNFGDLVYAADIERIAKEMSEVNYDLL